MKTVTQIASEIGISKQAVYQLIDKDFKRKFSIIDSSLKISLKGQKLIAEHFKPKSSKDNLNESLSTLNNSDPLIDYLKD